MLSTFDLPKIRREHKCVKLAQRLIVLEGLVVHKMFRGAPKKNKKESVRQHKLKNICYEASKDEVPLPTLIEPAIWVKRLGVIDNGVDRTPQAL